MSLKNSEAKSKYWDSVPDKKRSEIARKIARIRWDKATKEARKVQGMHLTKGRQKAI